MVSIFKTQGSKSPREIENEKTRISWARNWHTLFYLSFRLSNNFHYIPIYSFYYLICKTINIRMQTENPINKDVYKYRKKALPYGAGIKTTLTWVCFDLASQVFVTRLSINQDLQKPKILETEGHHSNRKEVVSFLVFCVKNLQCPKF